MIKEETGAVPVPPSITKGLTSIEIVKIRYDYGGDFQDKYWCVRIGGIIDDLKIIKNLKIQGIWIMINLSGSSFVRIFRRKKGVRFEGYNYDIGDRDFIYGCWE